MVGGHRRPHRRPHFFSFVVVLVGSPAERWSSSSFMVRRRAVGTNPGASTRAAAGQLGLIQGGGPWTRLQESRRDPGQNNLPLTRNSVHALSETQFASFEGIETVMQSVFCQKCVCCPGCEGEQARKLGSICDSYLRNLKLSLTH